MGHYFNRIFGLTKRGKKKSQIVNTEIRPIIFLVAEHGEALYSQQTQDLELTVGQIISSLLQNSSSNPLLYEAKAFRRLMVMIRANIYEALTV